MSHWSKTAEEKRQSVLNQIPNAWRIDVPSIEDAPSCVDLLDSLLPEPENEITNQSLISLKDKISDGVLTAFEVTNAFCHRAALAHQVINCCSEIFFDRALKRAKELDDIYRRTGKVVGPLHGIPISLKDQLNLEGLDSAIGYVSRLNKPKNKNEVSVIVDILHDAGAVFYVKTCVPMAMMADDTYSNIYGQTVNAHNRLLSAGGSSGGESSLIAAKGGLLGLSTDIGGSIRTPAAFNGIFAIKPSTGRLPYRKVTNSMAHQCVVPSVIGPSGRSLEDIQYFMKVILSAQPWLHDPRTPPIPWRPYDAPKKLAYGILYNNGHVTPHPPISRALKLLAECLRKEGHEVVEWVPPISHNELKDRLFDIFAADGYNEIKKTAFESGEPIPVQLLGVADHVEEELSVSQHWDQEKLKLEAQCAYDHYWLETKDQTSTGRPIDAWISPVWESVSFPAGEVRQFHGTYTAPMNYLDYPSVVIPVTFANKSIDKWEPATTPLSRCDVENLKDYDPELVDKNPVCLQVIARRYEEEKALQLAKIAHQSLFSL